ncbi:MAG: flagellar motor protein MotD [Gammaproteobacteria bacterium PRO9]|nr:flagellar motor protein MotD [Gammaproteobacteria bacterium PRO9]
MARKHEHEEHVNHEAWAIPYGDLVTLLLAFFVVMYAVSSVNEGKYRVLSDSLTAAFRGTPRTMEPVPVGNQIAKGHGDDNGKIRPNEAMKFPEKIKPEAKPAEDTQLQIQLDQMTADLEVAMQVLIDKDMIRVQRAASWVEVEIKTDILFPSGSAAIEPAAIPTLEKLAAILARRPYPIRVEGHTDNRPIHTAQFPSNWELSAARAARIVRLFAEHGIEPTRLVVAGMGENEPVADNATADGRNRNRRVALVILGAPPDASDPRPGAQPATDAEPAVTASPATTPEVTG